jgi:hypothetical protein
MPRDATIVLQSLECISQRDHPFFPAGDSPYIWPVLIWIDEMGFGGTTLFLGDSRLILQPGMRPGDIAAIPYPLGTLAHRFEDSSSVSQLLLVVLVQVLQNTPDNAVWAGCQAFANALPGAVAANLSGLIDPNTRVQAIASVKNSVGNSVKSAIEDALSWTEKLEVVYQSRRLDAQIGSDFYAPADLTAADFTLSMSDAAGDRYAVHGGLRVNVPAVDVCQLQADEVAAKQKVVDAANDQISGLRTQMAQASPAEKSFIAAQITQASATLAVAQQHLTDARAALKACRAHWTHVLESIPEAPGTPVLSTPAAPPGG